MRPSSRFLIWSNPRKVLFSPRRMVSSSITSRVVSAMLVHARHVFGLLLQVCGNLPEEGINLRL